jgi:hypothetical protein
MRFLWYVAGYVVCDKGGGSEIRPPRGKSKLDKQIHERKTDWWEHL